MSQYRPRTALILGGIRSGKSEFAESLIDDAPIVRYVATGRDPGTVPETEPQDDDWAARIAAHRERRPEQWTTEEVGGTPADLITLIGTAKPDDTLLVDDIGNWIAALFNTDTTAAIAELADAIAASPARIVIVSPEVGLSVIPATPAGRLFADANGAANRALAAVCDGVALVIAGQVTWLKAERPAARRDTGTEVVATAIPATSAVAVEATSAGLYETGSDESPVQIGMRLPQPDATTAGEAINRVGRLAVPGVGLGTLAPIVTFLAGAQGTSRPEPLRQVRVVSVGATHDGAIATGDDEAAWAARVQAARSGSGVLAQLAASAGVETIALELVDAGRAAAIETSDAMTEDEVTAGLTRGWLIAQAAADRGDQLIVLAAGGPGVDAAAAATVAAITRGEIAGLLGRVYSGSGVIDDNAWMTRCLTIRDTLRRIKPRIADGPHMLAAVAGPAIAVAAGLLLGAADRRTPVLIDGPVGAAAAVVARDYAIEVRLWCLLADDGGHPAVISAADLLGLTPLVSMHTGLGEGGTALAILPLLQNALTLSTMDS